MTEKTIEIEADSLNRAKQQVRSQIPAGLHLLSEKVISDGKSKTVKAKAETTEEAFTKAQAKVPKDANVIKKEEITAPSHRVITIEAFDEQSARSQLKGQIGKTAIIKFIKLVGLGNKGFLGIGKKPNQYEAEIFQQAVVKIIHKKKAKISATIGKIKRSARIKRSASDMRRLDDAEHNNSTVEVICEECGRVCQALGRPLSGGAVMVLTPDIAIIASRYCEKCKIVVCGGCTGVSLNDTGMRLSAPCPRCGRATIYGAVSHLRKTQTKLA